MLELFGKRRDVHVLYAFKEIEKYIEQIIAYAKNGIEAGDYVIIIENSRLLPRIRTELKKRFTEQEMEFTHFVNSFDFYCSSGSYHPPAIQAYFEKTVEPYLARQATFRAWAHVEWATMEEPVHIIRDFEKIIDVAVNDLEFPLICAYENKLMPENLKTMLLETHPYILVEDDVVISDLYVAAEA